MFSKYAFLVAQKLHSFMSRVDSQLRLFVFASIASAVVVVVCRCFVVWRYITSPFLAYSALLLSRCSSHLGEFTLECFLFPRYRQFSGDYPILRACVLQNPRICAEPSHRIPQNSQQIAKVCYSLTISRVLIFCFNISFNIKYRCVPTIALP